MCNKLFLFVQLLEKRLGQVEHPPGHTKLPKHPHLPGHPRQPAHVIKPPGPPGLLEHPRHIGILSKVAVFSTSETDHLL